MARPRTVGLDALLDVAERIATSAGPSGLTLRRLAVEAGASNGSIYHSFSSKEELLARVWIRAAQRLMSTLDARVAAATVGASAGAEAGVEAVVAAASSPVDFAIGHPASARLFFMQRRDQLLSEDLPPSVADELEVGQSAFTGQLIGLAQACWGRRDRVAVDVIAACVVDLPGGLMRRKLLAGAVMDDQIRAQIEAACRAILALELPSPVPRASSDSQQEA